MQFSRLFLTCILIGISSLPLIHFQSEVVPEDSDGLFLGKYRTPLKTPDPININTDNVTKRFDLDQLILKIDLSEKVIVKNNGETVEATVLNEESTKSTATQGVLMDNKYVLKEIIHFWTDDIKGAAGTTIDGEGSALKVVLIYFNEKYNTFDEALNHRYGLAEIGFGIDIGSVENNEFNSYAEILKKILEAGSEGVKTNLNTAIGWILKNAGNSPNSTYYGHLASYLNAKKNITYYSATAIILTSVTKIGKSQYEKTFLSMRNSSGEQETNKGKRFPQVMPVVQAKGVEIKNEI